MSKSYSNIDSQMIERIVREVVQRLTSGSPLNASANATNNNKTTKNIERADSLTLDQKVISVDSLKGRLESVSTLRVKPKTVVTPSARDELRTFNVELLFDLASSIDKKGRRVILATTLESQAKQLEQKLAQNGMSIDLRHDSRVSRLVSKLTNQFSTTDRAIVYTDQPYTAACVANRNPAVRAAVVRDESELKEIYSETSPNILIVPANSESILLTASKQLTQA